MHALVLLVGDGLLEVEELATPITYAPTFFVYVARDQDVPEWNFTGKDAKAMAILTERGVKVTESPIFPKPLFPLFFTERILCMSESMSREIFAAYEAAGWLDNHGYLTMNQYTEDWKSVLLEANALPFCEATGDLCLVERVEQELNMAFAMHSLVCEPFSIISAG